MTNAIFYNCLNTSALETEPKKKEKMEGFDNIPKLYETTKDKEDVESKKLKGMISFTHIYPRA